MSTAPARPGNTADDARVVTLRASRHDEGDRVSTHVDETQRHYKIRAAVAMAIVAGIAVIDVIIIKTTWNQILLDREILSWLLAIFSALGGAVAMWTSGKLTALHRVFPSRVKTVAAVLAVLAWAALGTGLFWLRWKAADLAEASATVEGQTATENTSTTHQLMAIVMITLYLVPGILAWIDGYLLNNPIAAQQRRTFKNLNLITERLQQVESKATMVTHLVEMHQSEIAATSARAREANRANTALAAELMAFARAEILRRLGDPAAGGITHPDDQPLFPTAEG